MKLEKFQKKVSDLSDYNSDGGRVEAEWVAEEGSEVMRVFRQAVKRGEPVNEDNLREEMGDTLLCLALLANVMEYDLGDVASDALDKLAEKAQTAAEVS